MKRYDVASIMHIERPCKQRLASYPKNSQ